MKPIYVECCQKVDMDSTFSFEKELTPALESWAQAKERWVSNSHRCDRCCKHKTRRTIELVPLAGRSRFGIRSRRFFGFQLAGPETYRDLIAQKQ